MSEPKFTPGPWRSTEGEFIDITTADGENICEMYYTEGEGHDVSPTADMNAEANAALIAAAPEMYDALYDLVCDDIDGLPHIQALRELLAKARGES